MGVRDQFSYHDAIRIRLGVPSNMHITSYLSHMFGVRTKILKINLFPQPWRPGRPEDDCIGGDPLFFPTSHCFARRRFFVQNHFKKKNVLRRFLAIYNFCKKKNIYIYIYIYIFFFFFLTCWFVCAYTLCFLFWCVGIFFFDNTPFVNTITYFSFLGARICTVRETRRGSRGLAQWHPLR